MSKIIEKQFYAIKIRLASPLKVASGLNANTDSDVLRNRDGEVFIPGTSVAGAFRDALGFDKDSECIMGYAAGEKGRMSSISISDIYFDDVAKVSARDGVSLNEEKLVNNKFDMEIVETGSIGTLFIQCTVREGHTSKEYSDAVKKVIIKLKSGEIRFGSKKNRGFGLVEIAKDNENKTEYIYHKTLNSELIANNHKDSFYEFVSNYKNLDLYEKEVIATWIGGFIDEAKYVKISVPLRLTGGISIRKYSTKPKQADYEHITCNGKPVIPGSSWNGAIRSDILWALKELGAKNANKLIDTWFGYVSLTDMTAEQSLVVFGESVIEDSVCVPMTRNRVNRFDGSVVDGALYSELSYFGGTTSLDIMVRKDDKKDYIALLGMLDIVIKDISAGYVAIGGQVAVGKGVFESNGDIYMSEKYDDALEHLYSVITKEK